MKLLVLIMAIMSISSSFAAESFSSSSAQFTETISVNKTIIDVRITDRGWYTEGSVFPILNLVSQKLVTFEYQFNPFSRNEVEGIFSNLEKESLFDCREIGNKEYSLATLAYPSDKYETVLNIDHTIKFRELDELDFGLSAFLETKCLLQIRLREKRQ
jgi:hypothetical protein